MARKTPANQSLTERGAAAAAARAAPYIVLARKYRPATFDDLIGQDATVTTLKNAFATDRIAQGYMLTGVRGVGKTTTARILARALNYERDGVDKPTFDMPAFGRHCVEIMEGRHPDVIEMDAASNTGVDNVREIIESARYLPLVARYKVYLIDEVHMLSKGAFNALLKTLEEPPQHVKFIFATTEVRKVPVTVLSRCQRFDLRRVDVPVLVQHFRNILAKERGTLKDDEGLALIARAAQGSVRDGLSLLDQALAMGSGAVAAANVRAMLGLADRGRIFDLVEKLLAGTAGEALELFAQLHRDGAEPLQILGDLAEAVHSATRAKVLGGAAVGEGLSSEERRRAADLGGRLSMPILARAWQVLLKGMDEAADAPNPMAAAEMVLVRLAYTADLPPPDAIIKALGEGAPDARPTRAGAAVAPALSTPVGPAIRMPQPPSSAWEGELDASFDLSGIQSGIEGGSGSGLANAIEANDVDAGAVDWDADDPDAHEERPDLRGAALESPTPRSFAEVVALAGARREAKLKYDLEERVSLVKFDPTGSIELHLLPGAPKELANELREKLNSWTGKRWVLALSNAPGERPLGEVEREREAAELRAIESHPAVAAVLKEFPGAKVKLAPLPSAKPEDTGTG
ncbi:MAG: DNA polymerase III subunit gamma/tau [Hyphomicrobiaceae bacterium]|nr:DNA polymerase III subunit gamma/tau [Hyphomicrobiaceae bacterium]